MSEDKEVPEKTPLDKKKDVLSQLKEMLHYSKSNIEHLGNIWVLFDDELKEKNRAAEIENLIGPENKMHEGLDAVIESLEKEIKKASAAE